MKASIAALALTTGLAVAATSLERRACETSLPSDEFIKSRTVSYCMDIKGDDTKTATTCSKFAEACIDTENKTGVRHSCTRFESIMACVDKMIDECPANGVKPSKTQPGSSDHIPVKRRLLKYCESLPAMASQHVECGEIAAKCVKDTRKNAGNSNVLKLGHACVDAAVQRLAFEKAKRDVTQRLEETCKGQSIELYRCKRAICFCQKLLNVPYKDGKTYDLGLEDKGLDCVMQRMATRFDDIPQEERDLCPTKCFKSPKEGIDNLGKLGLGVRHCSHVFNAY